jgi:hypothetical protein
LHQFCVEFNDILSLTGKTENANKSDVKLKVIVPFWSHESCAKAYKGQRKIEETQVRIGENVLKLRLIDLSSFLCRSAQVGRKVSTLLLDLTQNEIQHVFQ